MEDDIERAAASHGIQVSHVEAILLLGSLLVYVALLASWLAPLVTLVVAVVCTARNVGVTASWVLFGSFLVDAVLETARFVEGRFLLRFLSFESDWMQGVDLALSGVQLLAAVGTVVAFALFPGAETTDTADG